MSSDSNSKKIVNIDESTKPVPTKRVMVDLELGDNWLATNDGGAQQEDLNQPPSGDDRL